MRGVSRLVVAYGLFLIAVGIAGYLSNPEKARTALLSGGAFGGISIVLGVLMARKQRWAGYAAFGTTLLLTVAFGWRAWVGWMAVAAGEPKLIAASLISAMLVASLAMIPLLVRELGS